MRRSSSRIPALQAAMVSALPPEVVERIIDCLAVDQQALRSCTLVAREWYPRSVHHLYAILSPWSPRQFDALVRIRNQPRVAAALKEVHTLDLWPGIVRSRSNAKNIFPIPWYYRVPLMLGRPCPNVTTLNLRGLDFTRVPVHADPLVVGFPQFAKLRKLTLRSVSFRNLQQLQACVSAFPVLEALVVPGLSFRKYPQEGEPRDIPCVAEKRPALVYLWSNERYLWTWLMHTSTARTLRSLRIDVSSKGGVRALSTGGILSSFAERLEQLQLDISTQDVQDLADLNLELYIALRSLCISTQLGTECRFADILRLVSPVSRVRTLRLSGHGVHREAWGRLYDLLQSDQFSLLQEVDFAFRSWKSDLHGRGQDGMTLSELRQKLYISGIQVDT